MIGWMDDKVNGRTGQMDWLICDINIIIGTDILIGDPLGILDITDEVTKQHTFPDNDEII